MQLSSLLLLGIESIIDGESKEDLPLLLYMVTVAKNDIKLVLLACGQASLVEDCLSFKSIYKFF